MTFLQNLQAAGLPVIDANENGSVSMGAMTEEQRQKFNDVVLEYFKPLDYAALLAERADRQQLKDEYQNTITQLQSIENAVSPTNAQVIAAVKFLAKTLRLLLKLLARLLT